MQQRRSLLEVVVVAEDLLLFILSYIYYYYVIGLRLMIKSQKEETVQKLHECQHKRQQKAQRGK